MFILKLTDGTDVIDLISQDYRLEDGGLNIALPQAKEVWGGNSLYANGAQLILSTFENREATIMVEITGLTRDSLLTNVARVDRMIELAKLRSIEEGGRRIELQYAWDGASQTTYFEVISGNLTWPDNVMSVEQVHQQDAEGYFMISGFTLTLTLAPFAYSVSPVGGTPVAVSVTNRSGTSQKVQVYNCQDATRDRYVEIDGAVLPGSFPMPVMLTLESNTGQLERTSKVYIGVRKGDQAFRSMLDDKDATFTIGSAAHTADPDYSNGGTYTNLVFTGKTPTTLMSWLLSDADAQATQGAFRIFGRTKLGTYWDPQANYRLSIVSNTVTLYETEWRTPLNSSTTLFDFGTVFLPPWLGSLSDLAGYSIELRAMHKLDATQATIALDYLTLLPQDGGYRVLQFRGGGVAQAEKLIDDGWSNSVYFINLSGKKSGVPFGMMPPIQLRPGITQRLYFLQEGTAGSSEIDRKLYVSVGIVPAYMVLA